MLFQKVTLIGVGLLGGSLGLAIKQRQIAARVEGYVRRESSIAECEKYKVLDRATCDLASAVADSDLIVLCTPLAQMRELTAKMLSMVKPGTIITDVGSVKGVLVQDIEPLAKNVSASFIGSHPMAGGEKMGVSAARADLFNNAVCIVTPTAQSNPEALRKVEEFWTAVGMRILKTSPELHDELVSRSSHLPHIIAASLASLVLDPALPKEQPAVCANGFRDTTRIASGSPEMWRDISLMNRENLSREIGNYISDLEKIKAALDRGDEKAVFEFFEKGKRLRDDWRLP